MGPAGGNWKALFNAAKSGDLPEVEYWLGVGTDPNHQHAEMGCTPLIAAAENGRLVVVQALIEGGADPNVRSHWEGQTALEAARERGQTAVVSWLTHLDPEQALQQAGPLDSEPSSTIVGRSG